MYVCVSAFFTTYSILTKKIKNINKSIIIIKKKELSKTIKK